MVLHFSCTPCARRMLWLALLQGLVFYAPVATLYRQVRGVSLFQITLMEGISLGLSIVLELPCGLFQSVSDIAARCCFAARFICYPKSFSGRQTAFFSFCWKDCCWQWSWRASPVWMPHIWQQLHLPVSGSTSSGCMRGHPLPGCCWRIFVFLFFLPGITVRRHC